MKHKTAELEGELLDAAVCRAIFAREGVPAILQSQAMVEGFMEDGFSPSSSWSNAGPIIERERISLITVTVNWGSAPPAWVANIIGLPQPAGEGRTALEAAMRAFVASKLGEEVELP